MQKSVWSTHGETSPNPELAFKSGFSNRDDHRTLYPFPGFLCIE